MSKTPTLRANKKKKEYFFRRKIGPSISFNSKFYLAVDKQLNGQEYTHKSHADTSYCCVINNNISPWLLRVNNRDLYSTLCTLLDRSGAFVKPPSFCFCSFFFLILPSCLTIPFFFSPSSSLIRHFVTFKLEIPRRRKKKVQYEQKKQAHEPTTSSCLLSKCCHWKKKKKEEKENKKKNYAIVWWRRQRNATCSCFPFWGGT